jgi:hypothetical protein
VTPAVRQWLPKADVEIGRVYVGTPCYGGVCHASFAESVSDLRAELASRGAQMVWARTHGESLIQRARDTITATFMADEDASHLVWIDADIEFRAIDVIRLLCHDVDVIGGVYPKKTLPVELVVHPLDGAKMHSETGAVEVSVVGTGFLCTKRKVYNKLRQREPELAYHTIEDADRIKPWRHHYWPVAIEDGVLWSEDYLFCRRWRRYGGQVWADPAIKLTHIGAYEFREQPAPTVAVDCEAA